MDEIMEREARARRYSDKVTRRYQRKMDLMNRIVLRLFLFSVGFFLWAVSLALLIG